MDLEGSGPSKIVDLIERFQNLCLTSLSLLQDACLCLDKVQLVTSYLILVIVTCYLLLLLVACWEKIYNSFFCSGRNFGNIREVLFSEIWSAFWTWHYKKKKKTIFRWTSCYSKRKMAFLTPRTRGNLSVSFLSILEKVINIFFYKKNVIRV